MSALIARPGESAVGSLTPMTILTRVCDAVDDFGPKATLTKEQVQEEFGPNMKCLDFGKRDIGGRTYWRIVIQVRKEGTDWTTRQVMYQTWDEFEANPKARLIRRPLP